jgi:hypothetical protein
MIFALRKTFLLCLATICLAESVSLNSKKASDLRSLEFFGCVSAPCKNGGICNQLQNGGYICTCITGEFTGVNCETPKNTQTNNYNSNYNNNIYGLEQQGTFFNVIFCVF